MRLLAIFLSVFFAFVCSCSSSSQDASKNILQNEKDVLETVNQTLFELELEDIQDYLERINFRGIEDSTGLFYEIYNENEGISTNINDKVNISGKMCLLDGTVLFDSQKDGNLEFVLGKGYAEKGLERVLLLMRKGESAKIVMCSHLAYGLTGNASRNIPPKAPLIYEIKLENIYISKNNK